jgi:acyl-CoA carboxylase subunit alpha
VLSPSELDRSATLAALWLQGENRAHAPVLATVPSGWRNGRLPAQQVSLAHGDDVIDVRYQSRRDGSFALGDRGDRGTAHIYRWSPGEIDAEIEGRRMATQVTRAGDHLYVQAVRGTISFGIVPRFVVPGAAAMAGGLTAPMPGVVLDVRCAPGDQVETGQTLVVLEAMKMEHVVRAPADGVIADVRVAKGHHVENGALLLVFEPADGPASEDSP